MDSGEMARAVSIKGACRVYFLCVLLTGIVDFCRTDSTVSLPL